MKKIFILIKIKLIIFETNRGSKFRKRLLNCFLILCPASKTRPVRVGLVSWVFPTMGALIPLLRVDFFVKSEFISLCPEAAVGPIRFSIFVRDEVTALFIWQFQENKKGERE